MKRPKPINLKTYPHGNRTGLACPWCGLEFPWDHFPALPWCPVCVRRIRRDTLDEAIRKFAATADW